MNELLAACIGVVTFLSAVWVALAFHYRFPRSWLRLLASLLPLVITTAGLLLLPIYLAAAVGLGLFVVALLAWLRLSPRGDRDWADGLAVMPQLEVVDDTLVVRGFRNFRYDASGAAVMRYEERTFDLNRLTSVDYLLSHWSGRLMAHTLVSFGFSDGRYLVVSVEARRRRWQSYSPFWGLFRSYELIFLFGDERDIVRLRTNVRRERVYLYRVRMTSEKLRRLLDDYVGRARSLEIKPEWYNSVASNCTTNLFYQRLDRIPYWLLPAIFLNGLSARILHRLGFLEEQGFSFADLQARSEIRERALKAPDDETFSQCIRAVSTPSAAR